MEKLTSTKSLLSTFIDFMIEYGPETLIGSHSRHAIRCLGEKIFNITGDIDTLDEILFEICETKDDWVFAYDQVAKLWDHIEGWT